jgi:hypothetical protein
MVAEIPPMSLLEHTAILLRVSELSDSLLCLSLILCQDKVTEFFFFNLLILQNMGIHTK